MDWAAALELPESIRSFVDQFLAGHLSLPVLGDMGVPNYLGMPSMLLFRIGESPHSHSQQLKKALDGASSSSARCLIVSGASGCGKTRSLYDLFCEIDGLYLVVTTELNGGSKDVEHAIDLLKSRDDRLRRGHERPSAKSQSEELTSNRNVVTVLVTLLLACRMKIYEYCKSKEGYSPRKWLLLQAACRGFTTGGESDVPLKRDPFLELFQSAAELLLPLSREEMENELQPLLDQLCSMKTPIPTIAMDEAQVAMKLLADGYFWSASRSCYVPLANALEDALRVRKELAHVVLLSGTGYTLFFKQDLLGTGAAKLTASTEFTSFGSYTDAECILTYAKQAVVLSEEDEQDLKTVHTMFLGRFRPFAAVLEFMITKRWSLRQAATYVVAGLTTRAGLPEMKMSFYGMIDRLGREPAICHGVNLMGKLEMAVIQYFCTGRGFTLMESNEPCIALVEAGVGRLVKSGHVYCVQLEEYLTIAAARNYFEDKHQDNGCQRSSYLPSKWLEMSNRVPYPSGQGLCLQNFYALSFQSMWEKYDGVMERMPLIRPLLELDDCPDEFSYIATLTGVLAKGMMDVFVSTECYGPSRFLSDLENDKQVCTALVSGNNDAAADSVRAIKYETAEGEVLIMHILEQDKFPKRALSPTQMFDALVKTGFPEDSEEYKMLSDIQLRLLVIPPQLKPEDHPRYFWERHALDKAMGFIIVDAANVAELLGGDETAATFLGAMKIGGRLKRKFTSVKRFVTG